MNTAEHVQAGLARQAHELFVDLEHTPGASSYARTHATKRGWLSRAWWDEKSIDLPYALHEDTDDVDDIAIDRALASPEDVSPRPAEVEAVICQGVRQGISHDRIAEAAGVSSRTVLRRAAKDQQAPDRAA